MHTGSGWDAAAWAALGERIFKASPDTYREICQDLEEVAEAEELLASRAELRLSVAMIRLRMKMVA